MITKAREISDDKWVVLDRMVAIHILEKHLAGKATFHTLKLNLAGFLVDSNHDGTFGLETVFVINQ